VQALRIDARGSWSMTLSNDAELLLGRDDARLRLARFARLLPQLQAQDPRTLARADLRYTNGFALTWRETPGVGNRESGVERTPVADTLPPATRTLAFQPFPIPDSRFPAFPT
jgi:cell division protein FtsQ